MDLHDGQVPAAEVWAVVLDSPPGVRDVSWFITAETATEDYREVQPYVSRKGGTAERWHVTLPAQRMEASDVTVWVEAILLDDDRPLTSTHARRLDVFKPKPA